MFSLVSKAWTFLWSGDDEDDTSNDANTNFLPVKSENKVRHILGRVSHIHERHGLINGDLYFSFDNIIGDQYPKLNDNVSVLLSEHQNSATQTVVQVTVVAENWETTPSVDCGNELTEWQGSSVDTIRPGNRPQACTQSNYVNQDSENATASTVDVDPANYELVGNISKYSANTGIGMINGVLEFTVKNCIDNYSPYQGDWVMARLSDDSGQALGDGSGDQAVSTNTNLSCSVEPLRKQEFIGHVTGVMDDHGYIDGEIYFCLDACVDGYRPRRRDEVWGIAIESMQGRCSWRAMAIMHAGQIKHETDDRDKQRKESREVKELLRDKGGIHVEPYIVDFGKLQLGENKTLTLWIRNLGIIPQVLHTCDIKGVKKECMNGCLNSNSNNISHVSSELSTSPHSRKHERRKSGRNSSVASRIQESVLNQSADVSGCDSREVGCNTTTSSSNCDIPCPKLQDHQLKNKLLDNFNKHDKETNITIDNPHVVTDTDSMATCSTPIARRPANTHVSQFSVDSVRLVLEQKSGRTPHHQDVAANASVTLYPNMGMYVTIKCQPSSPGIERQLLLVEFHEFTIGRYITANVQDGFENYLDPVEVFSRKSVREGLDKYRMSVTMGPGNFLLPGERPKFKREFRLPKNLPDYAVPRHIKMCILDKQDIIPHVPELAMPLTFSNYIKRFHALLHLEEIQQEIDMHEFDMDRAERIFLKIYHWYDSVIKPVIPEVLLRPVGPMLAVEVPGLSEGRPSVLIGDRIILTEPGRESAQYEGFIHEVMKDQVCFKAHPSLHQKYNGEDYNVEFRINRATLRRCHQTVVLGQELGQKVLFPKVFEVQLPQWNPKQRKRLAHSLPHNNIISSRDTLTFHNKRLNERQKAAVSRILLGQCRPLPYIIYGPPGTGKTVTVVEAVLQIFTNLPSSRIIVATPSNSAADLLAERLHESGMLRTGDMVRLNAVQRDITLLPAAIQPYCSSGDNLPVVCHYRIIVCTCSTAGQLYSLGLHGGHFTHVFVDEAGQATEPECLIPVVLAAGANGQIVLAGDPMQLGPVLMSRLAISFGLELSFLERLTKLDLYARNVVKFPQEGYNPLLVTKLVENFRSHEALLELPSSIFYHSELLPMADRALTHQLCSWSELPKDGFPVIFHGVRGEDLREGNSPSWFNAAEVVQVMRYLQKLSSDESLQLTEADIGVITPYRKQVEKLQLMVSTLNLPAVKIGSVELFQGQERRVIIISTVRSDAKLLSFDQHHHIGFLSNPKRFNVAITRAQALLIIIGNPHTLIKDKYWLQLLQYCVNNGAYIGCDLPESLGEQTNSSLLT